MGGGGFWKRLKEKERYQKSRRFTERQRRVSGRDRMRSSHIQSSNLRIGGLEEGRMEGGGVINGEKECEADVPPTAGHSGGRLCLFPANPMAETC